MISSAHASGSYCSTNVPTNAPYVAIVAAVSMSSWSTAQRNAARRFGNSMSNQSLGVALARTVPQRKYIGFSSGEVARVRGTGVFRLVGRYELFLTELADRLEHRESGASG